MKRERIVKIRNLELSFPNPNNRFVRKKVIFGVDLDIYRGSVLALIGESGSGKTVLASVISGLLGPGAVISNGTVEVFGQRTENFNNADWEWSNLRGKKVAQVFQDPKDTLNRFKRIRPQIYEAFRVCRKKDIDRSNYYKEAVKNLKLAGFSEEFDRILHAYPHELSGGQRQRVVIAIALATGAELIICDEPTTALDSIVQAHVLNTLSDISKKTGVTIVFISHDLGVVSTIATHICVMYGGRIVEEGTAWEVMYNSKHPYTWGLLLSMPDLNTGAKRLKAIEGFVPGDLTNMEGDFFAERNPYALAMDYLKAPPFFKISDTHKVASWLYSEKAPKVAPPLEILKRWDYFKKNYQHVSASKVMRTPKRRQKPVKREG